MLLLLNTFQSGSTPDAALLAVYEADTAALEAAWRTSIGAAPRSSDLRDPNQTATPIPTIALALAAGNTPVPAPTSTATPDQPTRIITAVPATATATQPPPTTAALTPIAAAAGPNQSFLILGGIIALIAVVISLVIFQKRKSR